MLSRGTLQKDTQLLLPAGRAMEADRASAYGGFLLTLIGPRNHKLNSALRLFLIPCLLQSNMQAGELPGLSH